MRALSAILILFHCGTVLAAEPSDFFERRIRPVLVEHCYQCHSADGEIEGGLRLDSRDAMRRGGESGPAVKPKDLDESLILSALRYESLEMPPDQKLDEEVIRDFEKWIADGASDPREEQMTPTEQVTSEIDFEAGRNFWAFQQPQWQELPQHSLRAWPQRRLDHFVAARLDEHGLTPSPAAERVQLLRRLSFDLVGLPPSAMPIGGVDPRSQEVDSREVDSQDLEAVVERLLASQAFGEHWARMWLDVMRFAEDQAHIVGDNKSLFFPNSHRYRDWVIQALNDDMPYDEFIQLQLAADLLTPDNEQDDVALGFMGLGPKYYRRSSPEVMADEWEDRVDVLCRGLLGLTVACARCHDHKYDPISTADYYALAGVFASTEMYNRPLDEESETDKNGQAKKPEESIHIVREMDPKDLSIMIRGDVNRLGPQVPRGFLTVLSPTDRREFKAGSGRKELAKEIACRQNPLVARILVNRIWGQLIGKPLVATPSNFGTLGEKPSHPRLLDDLSVRFMDNGWSIKWLCREIVLSATYQQTTHPHLPENGQVGGEVPNLDHADPENKWLSRMNRKRLSVEQWRDSILVAAGIIDCGVGGESIDPDDPDISRRTVYSHASRLKLNPMLALFDYPDPNTHSAHRAKTTTPAQKLFLLNSPFSVARADDIAKRVQQATHDTGGRVREAYRLLFSRPPYPEEMRAAEEFLNDDQQWSQYIHALMIANEAFFID